MHIKTPTIGSSELNLTMLHVKWSSSAFSQINAYQSGEFDLWCRNIPAMISGQLFWFIEDFNKHLPKRNQLYLLVYAHHLCLWVSGIPLYHQTGLLRIFSSTTESLGDIFCYYLVFFYILFAWKLPFIKKYLRIQPITKGYHTDRNLL